MKKWRCRLLLLLMLIMLLQGCWDAEELEGMFYIHSIGIDYVEGEYVAYAQIMNFTGTGTGEQQGEITPEVVKVAVGKGESGTTSIHSLYTSIQRRVYWGHLSSLVFHERAMEAGKVKTILDEFSRFPEIRPTLWMYVTSEPLDQVMVSYPIMEISNLYSFLGEPVESYEQSSRVTPVMKHRFMADLYEPGKTLVVPKIRVAKHKWRDQSGAQENLMLNSASFYGGNEFKGTLHAEDIKGLIYMDPDASRIPLLVRENGDPAATVILAEPEMEITPNLEGSEPTFDINVTVGGNVIEILENVTEEFIKEQAAKTVESQIRQTFEKGIGLGADVYSFGEKIYRKDVKKWHELSEEGELPLTEDSLNDITVEVEIIHGGEERLPS
ncbi:Ger(x)C family spore germination protein [Alteribacter natronophilus]|uniref:Ger(x)C family spore germination protein n=1 Tax=Alteribacter natronophilus TaxID=2583810 RepID=UPI00110D7638|nr:Ger(x)C family spore germination protein [Alteribacter natronophilus]TMW70894.1 Ger(x)C family spore germination protein [Alteribacter natronophilus]